MQFLINGLPSASVAKQTWADRQAQKMDIPQRIVWPQSKRKDRRRESRAFGPRGVAPLPEASYYCRMPTISASRVPPPKTWEEFETITLAASKLRWGHSNFFKNGRQGQRQHGVDIWGEAHNQMLGVQCKNTAGSITLAMVKDEIENAESFTPPLNHLYIATTAANDSVLQKEVRRLSRTRAKSGKFRVDILFWNDVADDLAKDDGVFFAHYPQFRPASALTKQHDASLFKELTKLLRSDGVIGFIDAHNMAGFPFREMELEPLREFYFSWNRPEKEFISQELDKLRADLWAKVDEYYDVITSETFPCKNTEFHSVPAEWEIEQPERFRKAVATLHKLAAEIVQLHAAIVRAGRRVLIEG